MKKILLILCFFVLIKNDLHADSIDKSVNIQNNSDLYSLSELYKKTTPSTVSIRAYYDSSLDDTYSTFYRFWYGDEFSEKKRGTGFVYSEEGYIVTNWHVVSNCNYFEVDFSDGSYCDAMLIGCDERTDLAVLKVNTTNLSALSLKDREVEIGQWVYTVGHPYSFQNSLAIGIVAGKNRYDYYCDIEDFIQLDMNSNPGNSGGPVLTLDGKVIGMLTWRYDTGISFVIPTNIIKRVANQLIKYGRVSTGQFGFKNIILTENNLFEIYDIAANSSAAKGGLKKYDQIEEYDGIKVTTLISFYNYMSLLEQGDILTLKIIRNNNCFNVHIKKE